MAERTSYKYMGASMLDAAKILEPMRNNNFEVTIPSLANGDNLTLSVASYSAPQINVSTIQAAYANSKVKFAGLPEFPDSSIVLNDYISMDTQDTIMAWHKLVYDPETDVIGYAKDYKKDGILTEYTAKGDFVRQWILQGCWPSQVSLGDFNQEGGSIRQITLVLTYDKLFKDKSQTISDGAASVKKGYQNNSNRLVKAE